MNSTDDADSLYAGREQTLVKHFILEHYLERLAHIVGMGGWSTINYVDCFSGPWNSRSETLEDSSFAIALRELRKARSHLTDNGRPLTLRCLFLEKDASAYKQLQQFVDENTDVEIRAVNSSLEDAVDQIVEFAQREQSFTFLFVDPTGWTGFPMGRLARLLRLSPAELLVNFMTGDIKRFTSISNAVTQRTFEALFGTVDYRRRIEGLEGPDREDEIVRCYMDAIRKEGRYDYVCCAIVLQPQKNRTRFHLIYATRHIKGVEVFKKVERDAFEYMEDARSAAQQRVRVDKTQQMELFRRRSTYGHELRSRYVKAAQKRMSDIVDSRGRVSFDDLWIEAVQFPMVWDADVKRWIKDWEKEGRIRIEGLGERQRVPKLGGHHWIVLERKNQNE